MDVMAGQQPPYPGPYGPPPPGQPPPYPGPPGQDPYQQPYYGYPAYPGYAQPAKQPMDTAARLIGWLLVAAGLVVGVAAFLPWFSADAGAGAQEFRGVGIQDVEGTNLQASGGPGLITLILALVVVVFAIVRGCGALPLTAAIIGVVVGPLIAVAGVLYLASPDDAIVFEDRTTGADVEFPALVDWSTEIGVWFTLAGGLAMIVVSIVGLSKRR
jgi:hypothetical protein